MDNPELKDLLFQMTQLLAALTNEVAGLSEKTQPGSQDKGPAGHSRIADMQRMVDGLRAQLPKL
jgi:hypothetical protein